MRFHLGMPSRTPRPLLVNSSPFPAPEPEGRNSLARVRKPRVNFMAASWAGLYVLNFWTAVDNLHNIQ
jgi:hypothetical protein